MARENPIIYHIRLILRRATPEQLRVVYIFVRGYIGHEQDEEEAG